MVADVSRRVDSQNYNQSTLILQTTIDRAKQVMSTLGTAGGGGGRIPIVPRSVQESSKGITFTKKDLSPNQESERPPNIESSVAKVKLASAQLDPRTVVEKGVSGDGERFERDFYIQTSNKPLENYLPGNESVTDLVRYQKEEFWASLVHRGFIKPRRVTDIGSKDMQQVVEMMQSQKLHSLQVNNVEMGNITSNHRKEAFTDSKQGSITVDTAFRLKNTKTDTGIHLETTKAEKPRCSTNMRRQKTLVFGHHGDQGTQVGSSVNPTYSSSFSEQCADSQPSMSGSSTTKHSTSDVSSQVRNKRSESSDHVNGSYQQDSESQSTSKSSKSEGSASFPTYD